MNLAYRFITIIYNRFLATWHEPEEELNKLLLMKVSGRDQNVKVKMLVVCEVIIKQVCDGLSYERILIWGTFVAVAEVHV